MPEPDCDALTTSVADLGRTIVHPRNLIELSGSFRLRNTSNETVSETFHLVFESTSVSAPDVEAI